MIQAQVDQAYQDYQAALDRAQEADLAYTSALAAAYMMRAELEAAERRCDRLLKRYQGFLAARELSKI